MITLVNACFLHTHRTLTASFPIAKPTGAPH